MGSSAVPDDQIKRIKNKLRKGGLTKVKRGSVIIMLPFLFFGLFSGLYMNKIKKRRKLFPTMHAIGNIILLVLAFIQIVTGWRVYVNFIR